jgi:hypothetical protein
MVSSTYFLRASERATAIAILNRQRHLTHHAAGPPYHGENSGPGKDIVGEPDTQTRN